MTEARAPAAGDVAEESGYLASGGGSIYCTLFRRSRDVAGAPGLCAVLLGAFAEERKSSTRPLVEIARALASGGVPCARVDFRGCGDASGRSVEISLPGMIEDAVAAASGVAAELSCARVALCGLRLGGSVALLASPALKGTLGACVMIEPVVKGESYVRELTRKQAIRKMMTKGSAKGDEEGAGDVFDLDGIELARSFVDEMGGIDLVESARGPARGVPVAAIVQVGARTSPTRDNAALAGALGARLEVVRIEPFWLQTERVDVGPVASVVGDVLAEAGRDGGA